MGTLRASAEEIEAVSAGENLLVVSMITIIIFNKHHPHHHHHYYQVLPYLTYLSSIASMLIDSMVLS